MKKQVSHPSSAERMPIPFDVVDATFLPVEDRSAHFSKQGKGVLDMLRLRPNRSNANGDVKLRFLRSQTYATHSDLLRAAGIPIGEQPIPEVGWRFDRYKVAARYTARSGRRDPLEIGVMIGSTEQGKPVEDMNSYEALRQTVAVACGFVIAERELRRDAANASFRLNVVSNFLDQNLRNSQELAANNIQQLADKLAPR